MINAIILAGGKNSRMKKAKAFCEINGRPVIEIIIGKLNGLFSKIIVVTNNTQGYERYDVMLVEDVVKNRGPLAGIYSGLSASDKPHNFVVGCDMPFLNVDLIRHMTENTGENDVIVPRIKGFVEPLHGIYSRRCLPFIKKELDGNDAEVTGVKSFFSRVRVKYITEDEVSRFDRKLGSFFSINTNEDLEKAKSLKTNYK